MRNGGQNQYGPVDPATSRRTPYSSRVDTQCHFEAPVRFGRRKTDQVGHLLLTDHGLMFHGTVDLTVTWTEISRVEHRDQHIVASLEGSRKTLRFCCQTVDDAMRGAVVADHLVALAHSEPYQPA